MRKPTLNFTEERKGIWHVHALNGVLIGDMLEDVDGYLYFWPGRATGGCWPAHLMREIADKLDELNKPWSEQIMNDESIAGNPSLNATEMGAKMAEAYRSEIGKKAFPPADCAPEIV